MDGETLTSLIASLAARVGEEMRSVGGNAAAGINLYTSPEDFGSSFEADLGDVYEAMPNNSLLVAPSDSFSDASIPTKYGTLVLLRASRKERGACWVFGKTVNDSDWRCKLRLTGEEGLDTTTWEEIGAGSGSGSVDLSDYVTLGTEQIVTGAKTFYDNGYGDGYTGFGLRSDVEYGTNPSEATYPGIWIQDKNGERLGKIEYSIGSDGSRYAQMCVTKPNTAYSSTNQNYIRFGWDTSSNEYLKLGGLTVGSATKPMYLNSGVLTASASTVGSSTTPVYLNSGTVTATDLSNTYQLWRYAYVGQSSNTTTLPWYRFASIDISDVNSDRDICFKVNAGYSTNYNKCGLLTAHIRLGSTTDTFGNAQFYWEYACPGIDVSKFVLAYKLGSSTTNVELWVKIDTTYLFYFFEVLYEGYRSRHMNTNYWTLYSHSSQGYADSITSGYTQVESTLADLQNSAAKWNGASKTTGTGSPNGGSAGDIHFQYIN